MADVTTELMKYIDAITLTATHRKNLIQSRDALRNRIREYFKDELNKVCPKFHQQGSFAMKTTIVPLSGEYDIDDGVYLQDLNKDVSKWPSTGNVHKWLVSAVTGHTDTPPIDKNTCVRVTYAKNWHVDLPVYGVDNGVYYLAHKEKDWIASDSKKIVDWFHDAVVEKGEEFRSVVKIFKAWADFQENKSSCSKMPSGLILTVLVYNNWQYADRLDERMKKIANAMYYDIKNEVKVINPTDPTEVLSSRMSEAEKKNFQTKIESFSTALDKAFEESSKEEASRFWQKHLGDRFPIAADADAQKKKDIAAITRGFSGDTIKPWGM